MSEQKDPVRKKERDPIMTVCFVVLILAFAVVGAVFINDTYLKDSSGSRAYTGDSVKVNYVGSYYGFYTEDGAEVFDTSLWSVADSSDYDKSYEFSLKSKSSYAPLTFSIGLSTQYLPMFQNAAIGLKPGQSADVLIDPANGYGALKDGQLSSIGKKVTMDLNETMTVAKFKTVYGADLAGKQISSTEYLSPYGWNVTVSSNGTSVFITHNVTDDTTDNNNVYTMNDDVDVVVSNMTNGKFDYTYTMSITNDPSGNTIDYTETGNTTPTTYTQTRLVKIFFEDKTYYITGINGSGDTAKLLLKNTDERTGMYLYFTVTRVA